MNANAATFAPTTVTVEGAPSTLQIEAADLKTAGFHYVYKTSCTAHDYCEGRSTSFATSHEELTTVVFARHAKHLVDAVYFEHLDDCEKCRKGGMCKEGARMGREMTAARERVEQAMTA